mgnify:CR=1 FL=1
MATATLQQLMVINKGSSLPLLIKAKSFVLDIVTWAYIITFVARYTERIFTKPILESFFFVDVISIMFSVSAVLVILAYIWSILTVAKE